MPTQDLGWIKAEKKDWNGALSLIEIDYKEKRISSTWQINFAIIQMISGNQKLSIQLINELYANDKNAVDGYAKLGLYHYYINRNEKYFSALVQKDDELARLSINGKKIFAMALGVRGDLISAEKLIELLYSNHTSLKDGLAEMGWLLIKKGEKEIGLSLMEKEHILHRLSQIGWLTMHINYTKKVIIKKR
jgi:hypothetical protein